MKLLDPDFLSFLRTLDLGIHIIDSRGRTLFYNEAMEEIEHMQAKDVIGKTLEEIYVDWSPEKSTLMQTLKTGRPIFNLEQRYYSRYDKPIHTLNSSIPFFENGRLVGVLETSRDLTIIRAMTEQIADLRARIEAKKSKKPLESFKPNRYSFDNLIGRSEEFIQAIRLAKKAAETTSSVLICGNTGTGKELFAQSIHYEGQRRDKPFIAHNCAAIPEGLLESILFGTVRGAFTGAENRPGLFEQANGGTLFLDEINSMSTALQAKLLRVLQESYLRRVGGDKEIPVDVRIIASSNETAQELLEGGMRKDLYYRLNVINVQIPDLVHRRGDIEILSKYFVRSFSDQMNKDVWMISEEVMDNFNSYEWPGNVRELRNVIEACMTEISDENVIKLEHLPFHFKLKIKARPLSYTAVNLNEELANFERKIIMNYYDGNITTTAERLGVSRQNLQYKLKKHGL